MMWIDETNRENESGSDSDSSGEELPIWVRGEQRWVSGVVEETTCQDIIGVLLHDEENRGKQVGTVEDYHITERWRGVEQLLDPYSNILHIWNAWGTAQPEVKISLRRIKSEGSLSRKSRFRSNASLLSERSAFKTIHPKRLAALQNEKQPSSTEELLKLVLAQGKVIRKQLKKLRHSEHQIGFLEDKTHKARIQKHGRNYLLETYLKGLSEAVEPELDDITLADKNSDSGVLTEGDSEQSNNNKLDTENSFDRFSSPSSHEFSKDLRDDDTSSTISEATAKEQLDLYERIAKLNKRLLKEEEALARLYSSMKKYNKTKSASEDVNKSLTHLRTKMAKSSCEMQHNEVVLEETKDALDSRRSYLDTLHRDLINEDQEFDMLQTLLYSINLKAEPNPVPHNSNYTKELLDTLV